MVFRFFFLAFFLQNFLIVSQVIPTDLTLDQYLQLHGYDMLPEGSGSRDNYAIEGFLTDAQKQQFVELLKLHPNVTDVLEIGLNGGHSAEVFLKHCLNLKRFVSIDINWHYYTAHAVDYLSKKYQEQFVFIAGDSIVKVPEFATLYPEQKFDLIFIDGNHNYDYCLLDILNSRALARSKALLLIDDYDNLSVRQAVCKCQEMQIIKVCDVFHSQDPHGDRSWVEACYLDGNWFAP